jgi:hypothetical protein
MNFNLRDSIGVLVSGILMTSFAVPPKLRAQQQHVASPTDIHKELVNATQKRRQNREKVRELFSSKAAQRALRKAGMNPAQVKAGVAMLSDAELATLASRADKARADFAAGTLSDRDLLIILVGIAIIILIIVAV